MKDEVVPNIVAEEDLGACSCKLETLCMGIRLPQKNHAEEQLSEPQDDRGNGYLACFCSRSKSLLESLEML